MCVAAVGAGPSPIAPEDRTTAYVSALFAPFNQEQFPYHLDSRSLRAMIETPLHTLPVPVQHMHTLLAEYYPGLTKLSPSEHATKLYARLLEALSVLWPPGASEAELNYTSFWDTVGLRFPEWASSYVGFGQMVHR
jgi:hypothetical protein